MKKKKDVKKEIRKKKFVEKKKDMGKTEGGKYICPKCKGKNVGRVFSFRTLFGMIPKWRCKSCGLEEMVFPRVVKK